MSLLELSSLDKRYGAVHAVRAASASFDAGCLHLVCGENGAGKSTLLKMGAGIVTPDAGKVEIAGVRLSPHSPAAALAHGVAMVTQHFALAPALTVLENIALVTTGRLDLVALAKQVMEKQKVLGLSLPLSAPVSTLSVGDRQRTEIVRALMRDAKVLVLDEPTAILARAEVDALYTLLRKLCTEERAVVVVTHKMDEVRRFADRVTVMRKGQILWTKDVPRESPKTVDAFVDETVRVIMGDAKDLVAEAEKRGYRESASANERERGEIVLAVSELTVLGSSSFSIRAGEIVGVAGVEGNGQAELVLALADANDDAHVLVAGKPKVHGDISFVHEDRQTMGLVLEAPAGENLVLGELGAHTKHGLIDRESLAKSASARASAVAYTRGLDVRAGDLSGGNQQKLVVGRALGRDAPVLVFVHPTRGVDIAASAEIHERILEAAKKGRGVLVLSSDTDELRALSDRILVIAKHTIAGTFPPSVSEEELGAAMLSGAVA